MTEPAACDLCGREAVEPVTRRLYSADREEEPKDAAWSTSRVTLHLSRLQPHDVVICRACRAAARRWYLRPFLPFAVALLAWAAWIALQPRVAPDVAPEWLALPGLLVVALLIRAPLVVRRRYALGERNFAETPLTMFSLDCYAIRILTDKHPHRVYWTPRWWRYYSRRFQAPE